MLNQSRSKVKTSSHHASSIHWMLRTLVFFSLGIFGLRVLRTEAAIPDLIQSDSPDVSPSPLSSVSEELLFESDQKGVLHHNRRLLKEEEIEDKEQVLRLDQPFTKPFEGDYVGISAIQAGGDELPDWLNLEIETSSVIADPEHKLSYGSQMEKWNDFLIVRNNLGFDIFNAKDSRHLTPVSQYYYPRDPLCERSEFGGDPGSMIVMSTERIAIANDSVFIAITKRPLVFSSWNECVGYIEMVDISDPYQPKRMSGTPPVNSLYSIANLKVVDNFLLLNTWTKLYIYKINPDNSFELIYNYSTPFNIYDIQVMPAEKTLLIGTDAGIKALDLRPFKQSQGLNNTYPDLVNFPPISIPSCTGRMTFTQDNTLIGLSSSSLCSVKPQKDGLGAESIYLGSGSYSSQAKPILLKDMLIINKNDAELELWDMQVLSRPVRMGKAYLSSHENKPFADLIMIQDELLGISYHGGIERIDFSRAVLKGEARHQDEIIADGRMSVLLKAQDRRGAWHTSSVNFKVDEIIPLSTSGLRDQSLTPDEVRHIYLNTAKIFNQPSNSFLQCLLTSKDEKPLPSWIKLNWSPSLLPTYSEIPQDLSGMAVGKRTAFMTTNTGVEVMDVRHPFKPRRLRTVTTNNDVESRPLDIALSENQDAVYIVRGKAGLDTIQASPPESSSVITHNINNDPGFSYQNIKIAKNIACIAASNSTTSIIRFVDVQNIASPVFYDNSYSIGNSGVRDIVVYDDKLYILEEKWCPPVHVVNISNPKDPHLIRNEIRHLKWEYGCDITSLAIHENTLFLTANTGYLFLLNMNNLTAPVDFPEPYRETRTKEGNPLTSHKNKVAITDNGETLFIADETSGLYIVDVNQSTRIKRLGHYLSANSPARDVALVGTAAYMTNTKGLRIYDLRTWEISISPNSTDPTVEGNYHFELHAADRNGGTASDTFSVRIEGAPRLRYNLPTQYAVAGERYSWTIPADAFEDPNDDPIKFNASFEPKWRLEFNTLTATFFAWPSTNDDYDTVKITLNASDPLGKYIQARFNIVVLSKLYVKASMNPQAWIMGRPHNYTLDFLNIFSKNPRPLNYSLHILEGQPNLEWLHNSTSQPGWIAGTPPIKENSYQLTLLISVNDDLEHEASAPLTIVVQPNYRPDTTQSIPMQFLEAGERRSYPILTSSFFIDRNNDPLNYTLINMPSWIANETTFPMITLIMTPKKSDTYWFYPVISTVSLVATDPYGNNTTLPIQVQLAPTGWTYIKWIIISACSASVAAVLLAELMDRCRYDKTKKPDHEIESGHPFIIDLKTPRDLTGKVTIQEPREVDCLHRFFQPRKWACPSRIRPWFPRTSYVILPYNEAEVPWIEHDKSDGRNVIRSRGPVPEIKVNKELRVTVSRGGFFGKFIKDTQEHFFLKVRNNQEHGECISAIPEEEKEVVRRDSQSEARSPFAKDVQSSYNSMERGEMRQRDNRSKLPANTMYTHRHVHM